ncbi:MAG: fimbrillin family protein [Bacteroidetes bacterium]|nr:fimbrillin family protein [Bacteroidota bacterium]
MDRILLFATMLVMTFSFSSCSKDEVVDINRSSDEIAFNAYTSTPTKAKVIDADNFFVFNVYGYRTVTNYSGVTPLITYIDNLPVVREDATKTWTHDGKYYWPIDGTKLQFFAISPLNEQVTEYKTYESSYPTFIYTVNDAGVNQNDLTLSTSLNQEKSAGDLNLEFKHVLSQINFSLKGEADGFIYTVKNVELQNIKNSGKFLFDGTEGLGSWSDQAGKVNYLHTLSSFDIDGKNPKPINNEDKIMILMPQTTSDDAKIKVTYSVIQKLTNTKIFEGFKEVSISSSTWLKNTNVRYILTLPIGGKEITISAEVDKWDDENSEDLFILELNKKDVTISLLENNTEMLITKLIPANDEATYEWVSSDPSVAKVNSTTGEVTAIRLGSAIITVTAKIGEKILDTATCNVTVVGNIIFEDAVFKEELFKITPSIDTSGDGEISVSEAGAYEGVLDFDYKNITNIEEIKYFTKISELSLNVIESLTKIDVSKNIALEKLDCALTGISTLDVSNNINLTFLYCSNTNIDVLDVSNNTLLKTLRCSHTNIATLDLSNNKSLALLDIQANKNIKTIDISNNKDLIQLNISNLDISTIEISDKQSLLNLYCVGSSISTLDVSNNALLRSLYCGNTDISVLDVSKNENLNILNCSDMDINVLDVSKNLKLTNLDCGSMKNISELDIAKNINLTSLNCNGMDISTLDLSNNKLLKYLYCDDMDISVLDVSNHVYLEEFSCKNCLNLSGSGAVVGQLDISSSPGIYNFDCRNTPEIKSFLVESSIDINNLPSRWLGIGGRPITQ